MDWQAVQQVGLPAVLSLGIITWLLRYFERAQGESLELLRKMVHSQEMTAANVKRQSALLTRLLHELGVEVVGEDA